MASTIACDYLKLSLRSPVVVGACPLTLEPEKLRQMVDCGAGAVVLPSLFQEQLSAQGQMPVNPLEASDLAAQDFRHQVYNGGPERYLESIRELKRLAAVPIIASLSGYSAGPWLDFAGQLAAAGADAIELNLQPVIVDPQQPADEIEAGMVEIVRQVCPSVTIPVAVKTTRHFTNIAGLVQRLAAAGAAGVVLFAHEANWEVSLDRLHWTTRWELTPVDSVRGTIAGVIQARLGSGDVSTGGNVSIAASGGVRTAEDALQALIAGADAVMITSEIYRSGPPAISQIVQGITRYLELRGFRSLHELHAARPIPHARTQKLQRQTYLDPLTASKSYHDPTPAPSQQSGDKYGHRG